jgi:hypothetical protein
MARNAAPLLSFNAGEVGKLALARVDVAKMRLAARCQLNWAPWVTGAMMLRPGLQYAGEVLNDQPCRPIPFVFSRLDTALLELTPGKMRIWICNDPGLPGLVVRPAVTTTIGDPTFAGTGAWTTANTSSGASVSYSFGTCVLTCTPVGGLAQIQQTLAIPGGSINVEHGLRIVVNSGPVTLRVGSTVGGSDLIAQTVIDTGTHCLAFTPTGSAATIQIESVDAWNKVLASVTIDPPGPLVVPTPWGATALPNLRYDQSGDVVYVVCYSQAPQKIERRSLHSWSVALYKPANGPFAPLPTIAANLTPGAYFGNTTLTSDRALFQPGHVGALFRLFSSGQGNQAVLGAQNAFTPAVRVSGVGSTRNYGWSVTGTWTGTLTFQRSYEGASSGFIDVSTTTSNTTINSSTGGTSGSPDLDNVIAWERVGFKAGNYTSGSTIIGSNYSGDGGFSICRVTGYNSPTSVNIQIEQNCSSTAATADWLEGQWSGATTGAGYPTSVCFHEGRLWWFGQGGYLWGSQSDNYQGFADADIKGDSLGDSGAVIVQLGSGDVDTISWGVSVLRLLFGRERSIGSARSSAMDEPLTPTAFGVKDCSTQGAARLPPVKVDQRVVFIQESGRRVFDLSYNPYKQDYAARDLTRLNWDIGKAGFVDTGVQRQPDTMVHLVRSDGQVAIYLDDENDEVSCWWRLQTLGAIENICVLPSAANFEASVYYVVRRNVNSVTRRFIERLALRDNCVGGALNMQADCALVYQGPAVTSLNLSWLPSTPVVVWADGLFLGATTTDGTGNCAMPDGLAHLSIVVGLGGSVLTLTSSTLTNTFSLGTTAYNGYPAEVWADVGGTGMLSHLGPVAVVSGNVVLPQLGQALTCVVCLGYVAAFESAKLAYAGEAGVAALTIKKKIDHVGLVLFDTHYQGLQFGQRPDVLDSLPLVEAGQATPAGTVWPELDAVPIELPGEWDTDARLVLIAQAPLPCTLGGVVAQLATSDRG